MEPADPFAGRYQNLRLLARGGFGAVYRAWDMEMERDVALKILNADLASDADWRRRFRQEATAASRLNHPNITVVFDRGESAGQPFIVMELVEGETLSRVIEQRRPMSDIDRLSLLEQLCDGLHYAHQRQIVHRDVKPVNLIVREERDEDGRTVRTLKILDFGIAKVANAGLTATGGQMMFTPNYVSPEQIRGLAVDRRSDMFAVGAVAYELLTYTKAFAISSKNPFAFLEEVKRKVVEQPHRSMLLVRPDLDPELAGIIDRALAKDPADRFGDLAEMRRRLRGVRQRLELAAAQAAGQTAILPSPEVAAALDDARRALDADDPTGATRLVQAVLEREMPALVRRELEQTLENARERQAARRSDALAAQQRAEDERQLREAEERARAAADARAAEERRIAEEERLAALRRAEEQDRRAEDQRQLREAEERARAAADARAAEERRIAEEERLAALRRAEEQDQRAGDERRQREAEEQARAAEEAAARAAEEAVALARGLFAAGRHDEAVAVLASYADPVRVADALAALTTQARTLADASSIVEQGDAEARARALADVERTTDPMLAGLALEALRRRHDERRAEEARADEARQRQAAIDRAAASAVERARVQFVAGERAEALRSLAEFAPPHPVVSEALEELQAAAARLREQRVALERAAGELIAAAEAEFIAGEYEPALGRLMAFSDPSLVAGAVDRLQRARLTIARAAGRVRSGDRRHRAAALRELERFEPRALVAAVLRDAQRIDAERTAAEDDEASARAAVAAAEERFEAGAHEEALAALVAHAPRHPEIERALAALRARHMKLLADATVERSLALHAADRSADAIALLEAFQPPELVAETLATLRARERDARRRRLAQAAKAWVRLGAPAAVLAAAGYGAWLWLGPGSTDSTARTTIAPTSVPAPATTSASTTVPVFVDATSVTIDAQPWARVRVVPARGNPETVVQAGETPAVFLLLPGDYVVELQFGGQPPIVSEAISVGVTPLQRTFTRPGFDPDKAATELLGPER